MTRLLDRIASANGITAQASAWIAARVLPTQTAGAYCYWHCIGLTSICRRGWITNLEYCNGVPSGRTLCSETC
jgi:hypothetical protein